MKTKILITIFCIFATAVNTFNHGSSYAANPREISLPRYSNGYLVHGSFEILFINPEYVCYGFYATDNWKSYTCSLCKKTYYTQPFKDKNNNQYEICSQSKCTLSATGYHDNKKLEEIYPCGCSKDVYVK